MKFEVGRKRLITNSIENIGLVDLMDWYLENFVPEEKGHTYKAKVKDFEWLLIFAAHECRKGSRELQAGDLSPALVYGFREWRLSQGEAVSSVNRRFATIKHFCRKVKERAPIFMDPTEGMKPLPQEEYEFRGIDASEAESIVSGAYQIGTSHFFRHRCGVTVSILFATGLRAMEVASLTVGQLSDDRRHFRNVRCKGGKLRNVYIPDDLRDKINEWLPIREHALEEHLAGYNAIPHAARKFFALLPTISRANALDPESTHMDYKTLWRTVAKACEAADKERINPHRFRHGYAMRLLDGGMDIRGVAQALGHSDIAITMRYTERKEEQLGEMIEQAMRRA